MKINIRKTLPVLLAALLASGCGGSGKAAEAGKALEEKYGEKFRVSECGSSYDGYYMAIARSASLPDVEITAYVDDGGTGVSDNYAAKRLGLAISAMAEECLEGTRGDFFAYSHPMIEDFWLTEEVTPAEFAEMYPLNTFDINVYAEPDADPGAVYDALSALPSRLGNMMGSINVCFASPGTVGDIRKEISRKCSLSDSYKKLVSGSVTARISFSGGTVTTPRAQFCSEAAGS